MKDERPAKIGSSQSHAEWWKSSAEATVLAGAEEGAPEQPVVVPYTEAQAAASLNRAIRLVGVLAVIVMVVALWGGGWKAAGMAVVGATISASGLWEWRRLMTALLARMAAQDAVQQAGLPSDKVATGQVDAGARTATVRRPAIGFAVATFIVRLVVVLAIVYVSLTYLHGSVLALVAGLALGVVALTVEGIRLLRSGTI